MAKRRNKRVTYYWEPRLVREVRATMQLNAEEFGEYLGCSRRTVYRWETGDTQRPSRIFQRMIFDLHRRLVKKGRLNLLTFDRT